MSSQTISLNRLSRVPRVLLLPLLLAGLYGMSRMDTSPVGADFPAADTPLMAATAPLQTTATAQQATQQRWTSASPAVYARVARAFATESLQSVDLQGVECQQDRCRIFYQADPGINVARQLPRQLADSFNSMITVRGHLNDDGLSSVYMQLPSRS